MLCDACQRKGTCLPQRFAQHDQALHQMLDNLKQCDMRVVTQPTKPCVLKSFALKFRNGLTKLVSLHPPTSRYAPNRH
jgi:hypothetical protein